MQHTSFELRVGLFWYNFEKARTFGRYKNKPFPPACEASSPVSSL